MRRDVGGNWRSSAVCEATTGEIDVILEAMTEPPRLASVQVDRGYRKSMARQRLLVDVDEESITIPIAVMPAMPPAER